MPRDKLVFNHLRVTPMRRRIFFMGMDTILIALAVFLAFTLRFDGRLPLEYPYQLAFITGVSAVATIGTLLHFHVYRISWRHVGLRDIALIAIAVAFSTLLLAIVAQMLYMRVPSQAFPRSIPFIYAPLAFLALSAFRLSKRVYVGLQPGRGIKPAHPRSTTLLVGAGDAGQQVLRSIQDTPARHQHHVVGFVDDDPLAHGTIIEGKLVFGPTARIRHYIEANDVDNIVICVANAPSSFIRKVVDDCKQAGVDRIRIIPPVSQIVDGKVSFQATRKLSLEDLLGRKKINIRNQDLSALIQDKRVLVTGGAGTIGAEIARQVAHHHPQHLVVLDVDETRLHDTVLDLQQTVKGLQITGALVDVRDREAVDKLIQEHRPELVLHAAAYKHVPLMQQYPLAALETNVIGTRNVLEAAKENGCLRFVLISTDKAVEPVNVMGASKRLAEMVVLDPQTGGGMKRSAVRFGNVIGSRGSVIPIFERQIERGGPITVTHPDITRYFMITSEAVSLVLQSAAIGKGGDLFVLDMGKPVKILDVAKEFCRLKGFEPDVDIPIVFTGLRPGERLWESLHYEGEDVTPTDHSRVMRATGSTRLPDGPRFLTELETIIQERDTPASLALLKRTFSTFQDIPRPTPAGARGSTPPKAVS